VDCENHPTDAQPTSDEEWSIHALNIQGTFFERWCQEIVAETHHWSLAGANYPVEYPPSNGPLPGVQSELDIRAELRVGDNLLTLPIECKKHNPEFVNWIFFPLRRIGIPHPVQMYMLENVRLDQPSNGQENPAWPWRVQQSIHTFPLSLMPSDAAWETRGQYQDNKRGNKTKTSNAAITAAASQVALATKALIHQEQAISEVLARSSPSVVMPYREQLFLPTIVTTAKLFACSFHPSMVDSATGEIAREHPKLMPLPSVCFQYPLPVRLQGKPADLAQAVATRSLDAFTRMCIYVVHSEHFPQFLLSLAAGAQAFFGQPSDSAAV
jgi:hypothetical protein